MPTTLRLLPYYTGVKTLDEALKDKRSRGMLWLEILLNDKIEWERLFDITEVKSAYDKACLWYGSFSGLIGGFIDRKPLRRKKGKVDLREYRKLIEALNFVSET